MFILLSQVSVNVNTPGQGAVGCFVEFVFVVRFQESAGMNTGDDLL